MEEIDLACQDAVNGLPSRRPIIEMTIPSVLDKTISPSGTPFFFVLMCCCHFLFRMVLVCVIWLLLIPFSKVVK